MVTCHKHGVVCGQNVLVGVRKRRLQMVIHPLLNNSGQFVTFQGLFIESAHFPFRTTLKSFDSSPSAIYEQPLTDPFSQRLMKDLAQIQRFVLSLILLNLRKTFRNGGSHLSSTTMSLTSEKLGIAFHIYKVTNEVIDFPYIIVVSDSLQLQQQQLHEKLNPGMRLVTLVNYNRNENVTSLTSIPIVWRRFSSLKVLETSINIVIKSS